MADIAEIASSSHGEVNCYPGNPSHQCHRLACFVSVHGKLRKGKGHYNFAQVMEEFIQHMQGRCIGVTQHAVLMTDAWWHDHYEKWRDNIETIKQSGVMVEAYLIGLGGHVSRIDL